MSILEAAVLGIVQGLTEFLPVSSSGHLVLLSNVFGISSEHLFFEVMVHVGTLVAVFAVMWRQILAFQASVSKNGVSYHSHVTCCCIHIAVC